MVYFKKTGIVFLKLVLVFGSLVILYVLAALGLSRITINSNPSRVSKDVSIYILSNGVHTDIVVPVKNNLHDWSHQIKFENTLSKDTTATFLALGWGDKGFYLNTPTWDDLKFSTAFKATTGLSSSAMHCTFYHQLTENNKCKKIIISAAEYKELVTYVTRSFKVSQQAFEKIETNAIYGKNDAFYEATGSYNLFYTCNTWANNALKAAHQKAAFWTPYEEGIFVHYQ